MNISGFIFFKGNLAQGDLVDILTVGSVEEQSTLVRNVTDNTFEFWKAKYIGQGRFISDRYQLIKKIGEYTKCSNVPRLK